MSIRETPRRARFGGPWATWPAFFWRACSICGGEFRRERGWRWYDYPAINGSATEWTACPRCAPTKDDARALVGWQPTRRPISPVPAQRPASAAPRGGWGVKLSKKRRQRLADMLADSLAEDDRLTPDRASEHARELARLRRDRETITAAIAAIMEQSAAHATEGE
jgi:hypothetical protein